MMLGARGHFRGRIVIELLNYSGPASSSLAIHFLLSGLPRNYPLTSDVALGQVSPSLTSSQGSAGQMCKAALKSQI